MLQHDVLDAAEFAETRRELELERDGVEWEPAIEPEPPTPAPHAVQPPTTGLFRPELLNEDPTEWAKQYVDSLLGDPNWQAEHAKKQAEKQARRQAREERLAARQRRKRAK